MYNTTKKLFVALSVLAYSFATVYATDMVTNSGVNAGDVSVTQNATTAGNIAVDQGTKVGGFAMQEVKVQDLSTLKVIFNKELLSDTSMFEFLLTPKKDDTKEIALTGITLSASSELTVKTVEALTADEEYNLVVVFASDKEGNVIENGVDGMITFKATGSDAAPSNVEGELNAAPTTDSNSTTLEATPTESSNDANAASNSATPTADGNTDLTSAPTTETGVTAESAAGNATELPQTGPKEVMMLILAMLLGLGFMYVRQTKRA